MEKLHKQIDSIRTVEDFAVFAVIVMAASYIAYNVGLMNGRLGF